MQRRVVTQDGTWGELRGVKRLIISQDAADHFVLAHREFHCLLLKFLDKPRRETFAVGGSVAHGEYSRVTHMGSKGMGHDAES